MSLSIFGVWGWLAQFWHLGAAAAFIVGGAYVILARELSVFGKAIPALPVRVLGITMIACGVFMLGNAWGYQTAAGACQARELRAQIVARDQRIKDLERDIANTTIIAQSARARADAREKAASDLEKKVSQYEQDLAKRPDARCILGPDDIGGLQH